MMYYQHSVTAIADCLRGMGHEAQQSEMAEQTPEHLLWMCEQIAGFDESSRSDALKAARWIGWMLAVMERQCPGEWPNDLSRQLVRADEQAHLTDVLMYR